MKRVSIIIPVYNGEKYIERCLNSLINQSYKDIEIIAINDGSTDSTLEKLKKYKQIEIIDKITEQERYYLLKNYGDKLTPLGIQTIILALSEEMLCQRRGNCIT